MTKAFQTSHEITAKDIKKAQESTEAKLRAAIADLASSIPDFQESDDEAEGAEPVHSRRPR